ncbi:hypothetical protein [Streptomyces sp. 8K308]|uniref:hypothetical protein n=1 Tax=Streptomyces sp. 8K308 TaxID=2530388 RepID=UPI001FB7FA94|nr:hypothetical protein [Streptomyces sp. 8K308]
MSSHDVTELVGVSCLAAGADTLLAETVLEVGARLVLVIPARDYRARKVAPEHVLAFDRLLEAADEVVTMPWAKAGGEAYTAAGKELLRRADRLVAVWSGSPPTGKGGTADVVVQAQAAGLPVDVVWPEGAARRG